MNTLLSILIFSVTFLVFNAAYWILRARRVSREAWLMQRVALPSSTSGSGDVALRQMRLARDTRVREVLADWSIAHRVGRLLEQAGNELTVAGLLAQLFGLGVVGLLVGVALRLSGVATLWLIIVFPLLRTTWLFVERQRRFRKLDSQMPQALQLLIMFLRAGRSLPQALEGMAEELDSPAGPEFRMCLEAYRLGRPLNSSLKNLMERFPESIGLRLFVTSVVILGQTGGNLVKVIERVKDTLDMDQHYVKRLRALTGEARGSALLVSAMPGLFVGLMVLFKPAYFMGMFEHPLGYVIVATGIVLWLAGVIWIQYLMRHRPT